MENNTIYIIILSNMVKASIFILIYSAYYWPFKNIDNILWSKECMSREGCILDRV